MSLTPGEADRLLLFTQAQLARARRDRGLRLNVPEATAIIADAVCEWARDGLTLTEARDRARTILGADDVLPDVPEVLAEVRVQSRLLIQSERLVDEQRTVGASRSVGD